MVQGNCEHFENTPLRIHISHIPEFLLLQVKGSEKSTEYLNERCFYLLTLTLTHILTRISFHLTSMKKIQFSSYVYLLEW